MLLVRAMHDGNWSVGDNGDDGDCGNYYNIGLDFSNNGYQH